MYYMYMYMYTMVSKLHALLSVGVHCLILSLGLFTYNVAVFYLIYTEQIGITQKASKLSSWIDLMKP